MARARRHGGGREPYRPKLTVSLDPSAPPRPGYGNQTSRPRQALAAYTWMCTEVHNGASLYIKAFADARYSIEGKRLTITGPGQAAQANTNIWKHTIPQDLKLGLEKSNSLDLESLGLESPDLELEETVQVQVISSSFEQLPTKTHSQFPDNSGTYKRKQAM